MSVTSGGHGLEALEHRRQLVRVRRLGRDLDHLLDRPLVAVAIPGPDRRRKILQADDAIDEAVGLGRIVRGPQLEHELVLVAEVDGLLVLALVQVPEMQPPAIFGAEQNFRDQAVLEGIGRSPLARDQRVVTEMPPGIICEMLRPAVDLPLAAHIERLVVHQEHAARSLALAVAQRRDIDAFRAAMHRVRAAYSRPAPPPPAARSL